jgi:hypothetical protein
LEALGIEFLNITRDRASASACRASAPQTWVFKGRELPRTRRYRNAFDPDDNYQTPQVTTGFTYRQDWYMGRIRMGSIMTERDGDI